MVLLVKLIKMEDHWYFLNLRETNFLLPIKESGMNLGSYVASSGRSEEKNTAIGASPNSHHMYGEALDMNGEGYEWMRENGHKFGYNMSITMDLVVLTSNMLDQVQELHPK